MSNTAWKSREVGTPGNAAGGESDPFAGTRSGIAGVCATRTGRLRDRSGAERDQTIRRMPQLGRAWEGKS